MYRYHCTCAKFYGFLKESTGRSCRCVTPRLVLLASLHVKLKTYNSCINDCVCLPLDSTYIDINVGHRGGVAGSSATKGGTKIKNLSGISRFNVLSGTAGRWETDKTSQRNNVRF